MFKSFIVATEALKFGLMAGHVSAETTKTKIAAAKPDESLINSSDCIEACPRLKATKSEA